MLWVLWFATAFSYYGMVLASTEILQKKKTGKKVNWGCAAPFTPKTFISCQIDKFMCF